VVGIRKDSPISYRRKRTDIEGRKEEEKMNEQEERSEEREGVGCEVTMTGLASSVLY
jgi:hypothetical protein